MKPYHAASYLAPHRLPRTRPRVIRWLAEISVLLLIGAAGFLLFGWLLRDSLFIYGDNPGQFARLAFGQQYGIQGWVHEWYAGYPELQFYPPGFVFIGQVVALLHPGGLESDYNALLFVSALLPAFGAYTFCRYALREIVVPAGWTAGGVAALLALLFPVQWGGVHAVTIGLVGERLAFGLAPFALLAGWALVDMPNIRRATLFSAILALLALTHPFHAPAPVIATTLYALFRHAPRRAWMLLGVALAGTFGLIAWWLLPLLQYRAYAAPLLRADSAEIAGWLLAEPVPFLLVAAACALPATFALPSRAMASLRAIGALALLILAGILLNQLLVVEWLRITLFDPIRFVAEFYLALILLAGFAAALPWFVTVPSMRNVTALLLLISVLLAAHNSYSQIADSPERRATYFYEYWAQTPTFAGFWEALQQGEGRILYTSQYLTLSPPPDQSLPTAIKSLTSYYTDRAQIGGTFSHWSPVARLLWRGDPHAETLPERVEIGDDMTFLGTLWAELAPERFESVTRALNIGTIVAGAEDINARTFLDASPEWQSYWNNGAFYLYRPVTALAGWATTPDGNVTVVEHTPDAWTLHFEGASAPVSLSLAYFPTWRAQSGATPLPLHEGDYGLAVIEPGGAREVRLWYEPPRQGHWITALTLALLAGGALWKRRAG